MLGRRLEVAAFFLSYAMLYLTSTFPGELELLAPQAAVNPLLNTAVKRRGFITQASRRADGFCGRSRGLEISQITEQVSLDLDMSGVLSTHPFVNWVGAKADVLYFGSDRVLTSLTLSDISVDKASGRFRILTRDIMGRLDPGWIGHGEVQFPNSPYAAAGASYFGTASGQMTDNSRPFFMNVTYRAGYFTERLVDPSGSVDPGIILVDSTTDLSVGQEFYFSSDPVQEPDVDVRYIISVDPDNLEIGFTPELMIDLPAGVMLRQIDRPVRSACAEIISDLLVYPANTKEFQKGLGKRDLEKRWYRSNDDSIPASAQAALMDYMLA